MAPCQNRLDFGLLLKLVSPGFMDSTLSYGPKRKGPPSMEKGISDVISIVYLIVRVKYGKSRSFVNFSLQKLSFQSYNSCKILVSRALVSNKVEHNFIFSLPNRKN